MSEHIEQAIGEAVAKWDAAFPSRSTPERLTLLEYNVRKLAQAVEQEARRDERAAIYCALRRHINDGPDLTRLVYRLSDAHRDKCARLLKVERKKRRDERRKTLEEAAKVGDVLSAEYIAEAKKFDGDEPGNPRAQFAAWSTGARDTARAIRSLLDTPSQPGDSGDVPQEKKR